MTTLNDQINVFETDFHNAVALAEQERDAVVEQAEAGFAKVKTLAEKNRAKALKKVANDFFDQGGTVDEFAEAYGKSTVTTRNHLKAAGVAVPQGKKGAKSKHTEADQVALAEAWKDATGKDRMRLALDNDVTEATMRAWAIKHGVYVPAKREKVDA